MELRDALQMIGDRRDTRDQGLGGFQLACNAFDASAVDSLRVRNGGAVSRSR